nr:hypothetical protein [uncultured Duganella sp.]
MPAQSWDIHCKLADGNEKVFQREFAGRPTPGDAVLSIKKDILSYDLKLLGAQSDTGEVALRLLQGLGIHIIGISESRPELDI